MFHRSVHSHVLLSQVSGRSLAYSDVQCFQPGLHGGPNIFGTEPWDFYLRNLFLSFNLWLLLAAAAGPLLGIGISASKPNFGQSGPRSEV